MRSDVLDQTNRPAMLASDSTPTKPPAAAALTLEVPPSRKKSWIIGAACSRMPMPAVTLQKSTTQSNQNWGVLIAFAADTSAVVTSFFSRTCEASQPSGVQSSGGTRTVSAPNDMNTAYSAA